MIATFIERFGSTAATVGLWVLGGAAIDLLVYRVWLARAKARKHRASEIAAQAVHWLPTLAALLLGVRLAVRGLGLDVDARGFISAASQVVAIIAVTWKTAALSGRLVRLYTAREDTHLPSSSIFVNLARGAVWAVGGLIVLAALDVSVAPLITALGVGGLAIGLALQPTLENLFGGIQVLMSRQVEPGDFIRLESGEEGWVRDVTWRNTTVQMLSNDLVIVPNATIAKSRVVNFTSLDEQHSITVPLSVAYGSDLEHVERVTCDVARTVQREVEGAVPEWDPPIRFYEFGESGIRLRVVLRVGRYDERFPVLHAFIKRLHVAYADAGIEIPFPQREVRVRGAGGAMPGPEAATAGAGA